jgi:hypothetical protein
MRRATPLGPGPFAISSMIGLLSDISLYMVQSPINWRLPCGPHRAASFMPRGIDPNSCALKRIRRTSPSRRLPRLRNTGMSQCFLRFVWAKAVIAPGSRHVRSNRCGREEHQQRPEPVGGENRGEFASG